jgi:hypothetical protein
LTSADTRQAANVRNCNAHFIASTLLAAQATGQQ